MQRTISVMVGKGSVNHNSRKFHASNTEPERAYLNINYCSTSIKKVYRELFDDAVKKHNTKQTRNDRRIKNYYEKIRNGRQEKTFHEIILQIGNKDDMNAKDENGQLAIKILDQYMQNFQSRNPNLRVFSAHLHLDEATPHLHIDFVPFTTGSKRGLETRVSLKQALATQGFKGGTRGDTEWNQWVFSEKQQLAVVMEHYNVHWQQKGTHEKHLSVLNYEKKMRSEEICKLDVEIKGRYMDSVGVEERIVAVKNELSDAELDLQAEKEKFEQFSAINQGLEMTLEKYNVDSEWQLPEPTTFSTAKSYKEKFVQPLINKFKKVISGLFSEFERLKSTIKNLQNQLWRQNDMVNYLDDRLEKTVRDRNALKKFKKDYNTIRQELGDKKTDVILAKAQKKQEIYNNSLSRNENYDYER